MWNKNTVGLNAIIVQLIRTMVVVKLLLCITGHLVGSGLWTAMLVMNEIEEIT